MDGKKKKAEAFEHREQQIKEIKLFIQICTINSVKFWSYKNLIFASHSLTIELSESQSREQLLAACPRGGTGFQEETTY